MSTTVHVEFYNNTQRPVDEGLRNPFRYHRDYCDSRKLAFKLVQKIADWIKNNIRTIKRVVFENVCGRLTLMVFV